jgi:3-deoxy-D-manno-octulosonate 8-phosphate phosphatase (KDO 8-P phosphatase)
MTDSLPSLIITDIDGVWTDGGMYYDQMGNEWKKFNTSDSAGVIFAEKLGIEIAVITGEDTKIVARRCAKLQIENVYQGVKDKLTVAKQLCEKLNITLSEVAYIGDDIGDLLLLKKVGISGTPSSAQPYIKSEVDFVTQKAGGQGAFREFVESIIGIQKVQKILKVLN